MLEYARASGYSSSISWLADVTGFVIHDKDDMMNDITPMFFSHTKFRSFVSVLILTAVAVEVEAQRLLLLSISTLIDLASLLSLSHSSLSISPISTSPTLFPDTTAESMGLPSHQPKRGQLETQGLPP
jgi:hypothetical protein